MQDPLDAMNITLKGVDTEIPVLPQGNYAVQCTASTVDPNKDKSGWNWNLKLELMEEAESVNGRTVKPGFPLYHVSALQAKADSTDPEAFKRSIAENIDALFNTDAQNRPDLSREVIEAAVGRQCVAQTYVDEWPEGSGNKKTKVRHLRKFAA